MTSFNLNLILMRFNQKAQIVLLTIKKLQILEKYSDFLDIFLKIKILVLLGASYLK